MDRVRLLIAVPHRLIISGIREAIRPDEAIEVVAEVETWSQLLPAITATSPDVVLLDSDLTGAPQLVAIDVIRQRQPNVKIVVLSDVADATYIHNVLSRGANGYILKSIDPADLASALRQTAEGVVYHALSAREPIEGRAARAAGLTDREASILAAVAQGLSNRQIADKFSVTEQTVKFHLTNIYRKLNVTNRLTAARYAYEHGLAQGIFDEGQ
jgi:two-component system NarL family response regulator